MEDSAAVVVISKAVVEDSAAVVVISPAVVVDSLIEVVLASEVEKSSHTIKVTEIKHLTSVQAEDPRTDPPEVCKGVLALQLLELEKEAAEADLNQAEHWVKKRKGLMSLQEDTMMSLKEVASEEEEAELLLEIANL